MRKSWKSFKNQTSRFYWELNLSAPKRVKAGVSVEWRMSTETLAIEGLHWYSETLQSTFTHGVMFVK
jgi:hypothetical protein